MFNSATLLKRHTVACTFSTLDETDTAAIVAFEMLCATAIFMKEDAFVGTRTSGAHTCVASEANGVTRRTASLIGIAKLCTARPMRYGNTQIPLANGILQTTHVIFTFIWLISNGE
jgi:hypothetical protein